MTIYAALLRGINVGGNNKIKMAELKKSFEALGLAKVRTYIQSGNVLFASDETEPELREKIEGLLEQEYGFSGKAILRTADELKQIASVIPFSEAEIAAAKALSPGECLYVSMLQSEPAPDKAEKLQAFDFKDDRFRIAGRDVFLLFHQSLRNSKLAVQVEKLGVPATTRNFNTINKLIELAEDMV